MFMYGSSHSGYGAIGAGEGAFYSNTNINIMSDSASGVIKFSTGSSGGSERMRLDSSGNVGIGNTSPSSFSSGADNLVVGTGSGDNGITLYSGTTSVSRLHFADGTSAGGQYDGFITYDHNGQAMLFGTGATGGVDVTLDSSGNVGIGTTSPAGKLDVSVASNQRVYKGLTILVVHHEYLAEMTRQLSFLFQ